MFLWRYVVRPVFADELDNFLHLLIVVENEILELKSQYRSIVRYITDHCPVIAEYARKRFRFRRKHMISIASLLDEQISGIAVHNDDSDVFHI